MTELEKELLQTVKEQPKIFEKELKTIAKSYLEQLRNTAESYITQLESITSDYKKRENELLEIIEIQRKTLAKYNNLLENLKAPNQEEMKQLTILREELAQLENLDKDLYSKIDDLNSLLSRL